MTWFNLYSGYLSIIIITILVLVILYYTLEIRKQAKYAHKALEIEVRRSKNTGINYAYLINTELTFNQNIFMGYINDRVKFVDSAVVFYNLNNFQNLRYDIWEKLRTEVPKYYSATLMYELVEYYSSIDIMASNTHLTDEQKYEMVEVIFASMYKIINLIESEFKIEIRKRDTYTMEDCTIKINTKTGELSVVPKS